MNNLEQKPDYTEFDKGVAKLRANSDFIAWENDLIAEADKKGVKIDPAHGDALVGIYVLKGDYYTMSGCLKHYEDFCRRWKALNGLKK